MPRRSVSPPALVGPRVARREDIPALNRLFAEAFTDRYHRDGLTTLRVPYLNPLVWQYAFATAGEGALLWHDDRGNLLAFTMVHQAGVEGWMGPLAVRPDAQGHGIGTTIVEEGVARLTAGGARVIGLETMPRTAENIGFYAGLGFVPCPLTITLAGDLTEGCGEVDGTFRVEPEVGCAEDAACLILADRLLPGVTWEREIRETRALAMGGVSLVRHADGGDVAGWALWHSAPLAQGRGVDEVRILKVVAESEAAFAATVAAAEVGARRAGGTSLLIRCQTASSAAWTVLIHRGYQVHWTDLRMTLDQYPEREPTAGVVLSNWEI